MARTNRLTVQEVCVRRLGVHRGALAAARVAMMAIAANELGHFPSATEYAEYWAVDERTAWRHRAAAVAGVVGPTVQDDDALEVLRAVVDVLAKHIAATQERSPKRVAATALPRTNKLVRLRVLTPVA